MPRYELMIDAEHATAGNIPADTPKVAGYVTGTADVQWTAEDWARYPHSGHVRIDQHGDPALHAAVIDGELAAVAPAIAADCIRARLNGGHAGAGLYASESSVESYGAALDAISIARARVGLWLADWNLDELGAAGLLGTVLHGFTVRAVQWASPASNPRTVCPGSTLTLSQANVDLSVTQPGWYSVPAPWTPPTEAAVLHAMTLADVASNAVLTLGRAVKGL